MQLGQEAKIQLRNILKKELGDYAETLSDEQVEALGLRLLRLTAVVMKRKISSVSTLEE